MNLQCGSRELQFRIVLICTLLVFAALGSIPGTLLLKRAAAQSDIPDDELQDITENDFPLDDVPPTVRILSPSSCSEPILSPGVVIVKGIASDESSGVNKVEAFSHTYPLNDEFPFKLASRSASGDWSSWSIPVQIYENATRILVRVTDNAGNENWDEVTVDVAHEEELLNIQNLDPENGVAFVDPSFTYAAYGVGGFYEFYAKYHGVSPGNAVTTDLDLMTADIQRDSDRSYYEPLLQKVKEYIPDGSSVSVISDMDIHTGVIFRPDGSNSFKALFLLHDEYIAQQGYDNLKRFVNNGGTLVFIDGNTFYAEVSYDSNECTVTLVKGHDWEFDGEKAWKSVSERYLEENRQWMGTNYMINALQNPIDFTNNLFNYTHFEENYVSNPNATILQDYGLTIGDSYDREAWHRNATVATYELQYGQGKVIGLGIYGQNKASDPLFLDFFDKVVLTHALGNEYRINTGDKEHSVYWKMDSGRVSGISVDSESHRLVVTVEGIQIDGGSLRLALPKDLIDVSDSKSERDGSYIAGNSQASQFTSLSQDELGITSMSVDGSTKNIAGNQVRENVIDHERIIDISLEPGTSKVEIYGAYIAPEFGTVSGSLIMIFLAITCMLLLGKIPSLKSSL